MKIDKKVFFQFDDDEPVQLGVVGMEGKIVLVIKEGNMCFESGGKKFQIYIEKHVGKVLTKQEVMDGRSSKYQFKL